MEIGDWWLGTGGWDLVVGGKLAGWAGLGWLGWAGWELETGDWRLGRLVAWGWTDWLVLLGRLAG